MDIEKLQQFLQDNNLPKFRLGQIQKAIFADGVSSFGEITTLSKDLREKMENEMRLLSFDVEKVLVANDGQSIKALLKLHSGDLIETVLISPKPGVWSACISCQVGCAMGCRFCATGKMGFKRDLTAEEITDQILFWRQYLKKNFKSFQNSKFEIQNYNVGNIVYMGMGEPFNNWENVAESIKVLTDEKLFGFGSRSISVSTSGIADGIERMATEFPQVNLAISLHFASDEKRDRFMPVNKKDNLENLRQALKKYFQITTRKVFLEYIMLDGINDTALDAKLLADFIYSIGNTHLLHMNLIRYNMTSEDLKPSSKTRTQLFKQELEKHSINATIRKSLGEEIEAACGQLAGKN
ncbi:MAG: YloN [Candidatus Moranbacteria bacterium GW2011_GWC2_37_73]|nr:MAG: YloN [Parcubacteria group bacterium GW2011_GWC1_36_108]KKQ01193.1 MAG: YloN [Candidatus Moranbacteria bacterium GW2011_GWD1_36_198]KKQ02394.1 MAG: YloN [Candidatus Moranbacteria bacterium GW2011_GWD2_36_198]KKQ40073.1 MAG: YloN [Candidatus Moranbacteria bacterium GW2011_GWC2_37_73]HAR99543.1 23S rRNA (adenine(2503)-C(2))-methyltransferase RlmN [Candidatus Moranbacteria bacterium]